MEAIPGGPKLPRTPQGPMSVGTKSGGRTPAPSPQEAAPESPADAQQSPKISFAPGSQASMQSPVAAELSVACLVELLSYVQVILGCTLLGMQCDTCCDVKSCVTSGAQAEHGSM